MYAWRGTLLICSALLLNCVPCALIFRNKFTTDETPRNSNYEKVQFNDISDKENDYSQKNNCDTQSAGAISECYKEKEIIIEKERQRMEIVIEKYDTFNTVIHANKEEEPEVNEKMLKDGDNVEDNASTKVGRHRCLSLSNLTLFKILRQREMILFYIAQIMFFIGFYFPIIGLPGMAIQYGNNYFLCILSLLCGL
jgi:hypothetical protein